MVKASDKTALQLYSLRDMAQKDFAGTMKEVAKAGYAGVEFAGYYNTPADETAKLLKGLGLVTAGTHLSIDQLTDQFDEVIGYAHAIGAQTAVCPALPVQMRDSRDAWLRSGVLMNEIGRKCKENGISFGYHNHYWEFEKFDGEYAFDILAANTDPAFVFLELDTYWIEYAGLSAAEYVAKYNTRCRLLHFKDMKDRTTKKCTELGKGVIDFKELSAMGKQFGCEWYIVEQEEFEIPEPASIRQSADYLKSIL